MIQRAGLKAVYSIWIRCPGVDLPTADRTLSRAPEDLAKDDGLFAKLSNFFPTLPSLFSYSLLCHTSSTVSILLNSPPHSSSTTKETIHESRCNFRNSFSTAQRPRRIT